MHRSWQKGKRGLPRGRSLAAIVAIGLVGAMPLAMLPSLTEAGATATPKAKAHTTATVSKMSAPAQSLPSVPGGQPHTGEGALSRMPTPSPNGTTSRPSMARASSGSARTNAIVGSPPIVLLPSMLNEPQSVQPNSIDRTVSTYDSTHNQVVDFGGCSSGMSATCTAWSNHTDTFDGSQWTALAPATSPTARTDSSLTFDPISGTAVLFGGENGSGALSDTWVWNGTTWTQSTGAVHPSARHGAVAAFLPSTGLVYLFGGQSGSSYLSDTWSWNGSAWTQLTPSSSPSARALASMAYAGTLGTSANDLLLYGGTNASGDLGDTWLWNGTTWSNPTLTEGPGPLEQSALAYDPTMSVPLLLGGEDSGVADTGLWSWNGTEWQEGGGSAAVALFGMTMAQDPTNGQLVVNGGEYSATSTNYETFKVDYLNGHPRSGTSFSHSLDDHLTETINPATTALYLQQNDFNIGGVGMSLNISQNYTDEGGCISQYVGCLWTAGILDVAAYSQPDGTSRVLQLPDGSLNLCTGTGTTWTCPVGSDLSYNGSKIVQLHSQITYNLNSSHQVSTIVDRNGHTITVNYGGGAGTQATSITDTEGRTTTLSYTSGNLTKITDPAGRTVTLTYSGSAWPPLQSIAVADPSDPTGPAVTSFADLGFGDGLDVTTPAGRETRYGYGSMNRINDVTRVTNTSTGAGDKTDYNSYANHGSVVVTDPNNHASTYTVTGTQITKAVDALGNIQLSTYDPASDPKTLENGLTQITTLAWDTNSNLDQITSPASATGQTPANSYFAYNTPISGGGAVAGGQFLSSSGLDAQGNCSAFTYDASGNQTATYSGLTATTGTTNCDGQSTGTGVTSVVNAYQGDGSTSCSAQTGELCTTTSGAGNVTSYGYDTLGNVTSVTQPGGNCVVGTRTLCTTITYDGLSRPLSVTDGKGQKTAYTYDKFDRITQILYNGTTTCSTSAGTCLKYTYDADGNVTTRVDKTGTTTFTYDSLNRMINEALPSALDKCSGSSPAGITFTYDAASNLTQYCDTGGNVNYAYDAANHNIGTATGSGSCIPGAIVQPCTTYAYNAGNEVTGITYPTSTGVIDTLGYDFAGNLTSTVVSKGSTNLEDLTYSYAFGTADKPLQQTMTNVTSGVTTTYSYDSHDRLARANTGTTATSQTYGYDTDGNLNTETLGLATKTLQYSASDALCWAVSGPPSSNPCSSAPTGATTYTYDANGNQTSSSAGFAATYNSVNQTATMTSPTSGSALSMAYTGTNSAQRTSAGTTTFANSLFGVASSKTGSTSTYFTHDAGGGLNSIKVGSARYYVYGDGAGSVAGLVNSSGANVASYTYDPYGSTTSSGTKASVDPFRFKGGYQDTTGFYKFGTRYYNPGTSSWTQQDSIAGTIQSPSAVNRYPYAGDDPVNLVDPNGASFFGAIGNALSTAAGVVGCVAGSFLPSSPSLGNLGLSAGTYGLVAGGSLITGSAALSGIAAFGVATAGVGFVIAGAALIGYGIYQYVQSC